MSLAVLQPDPEYNNRPDAETEIAQLNAIFEEPSFIKPAPGEIVITPTRNRVANAAGFVSLSRAMPKFDTYLSN